MYIRFLLSHYNSLNHKKIGEFPQFYLKGGSHHEEHEEKVEQLAYSAIFATFVVKNDNAVVKSFNTDSPNMLQKGTTKKRGMSCKKIPLSSKVFSRVSLLT